MKLIEKQLQKVKRHYEALKEYKEFIEKSGFDFSGRYTRFGQTAQTL